MGWPPIDFCRQNGAFVYQLGHGPLKAERRVRFPYALPLLWAFTSKEQALLPLLPFVEAQFPNYNAHRHSRV